jgi:drug/metabolite transporter (DMT)-like permease
LISRGVAQLFSQILIAVAYRYASAEKVGPFIYSVIVFSALIDWIVWSNPPTLFAYLGMALVICGGLIAVRARPAPSTTVSGHQSEGSQRGGGLKTLRRDRHRHDLVGACCWCR